MKQTISYLSIFALVILQFSIEAQSNINLKLYAILGTKQNTFTSKVGTDLNTNYQSFTLGAGSRYLFNRFFFGSEFYYSTDKNLNNNYKTDYLGFNSTVFGGYNVLKSSKLALEPSLGFAVSKNRLIVNDKKKFANTHLTNNQYGVSSSISLSRYTRNGITFGLKIGYYWAIPSQTFWKNEANETLTAYKENMSSFSVQLTTGGIITLMGKNKTKDDDISENNPFLNTKKINKMTTVVDNKGDKLFTMIYPNEGKETVILLHGGPGFPSDLTEVAEILAEKYQVITFHQRGTKKSPCSTGDYSMKAYLSDIEAIARHFNLQTFHLWGHSWGGLYAQIYAQEYPDKLLSLFLCCPGSGTNTEWQQTEKEVMQLNKSKCTFGEWTKMGINNVFGMLGSNNAYKRLFKQVMKNYNDGFVKTDSLGIDFDNLKAEPINKTRKGIVKYPLLKTLIHSPYKITIVYGDQDIYKNSKDFVINRYPTANVQIIEHSGHIPWLHNPTKYQKILRLHFSM